ncbi:UNVERIFIED_CONTAM: hypothetical protein O8I53_13890 [Campylobacter lari]
MQYLSINQIKDFNKYINFEMKLFLNNNLFSNSNTKENFLISKIKKEISNNFDINLENYLIASKKNVDKFKYNIKVNQQKIQKAKNKIYKVKDSFSFELIFKN